MSRSLNSWFKEVQELRERAVEYSKRARGTHFSREHLAQLYAQQNELWNKQGSVEGSMSTSRTIDGSMSSSRSCVMESSNTISSGHAKNEDGEQNG